MSIQIVHDEDPPRLRVGLDRVKNVPHEIFFRACHTNGRRGHLALYYIPIADQAQRPMSRVFEFDPLHLAGLHRDRLGNTLQRLNTRHLVHRDGIRILLEIQVWSFQIRLTNGLYLLFENLGIFLLGGEPILAAVRL